MKTGKPRLPRALSSAEELLALQLRAASIPFQREVRLVEARRWRWDFLVADVAVEVQGWGRHQRFIGYEGDCAKSASCMLAGYRPLAVTPRQVNSGQALDWIKRLLAVRVPG